MVEEYNEEEEEEEEALDEQSKRRRRRLMRRREGRGWGGPCTCPHAGLHGHQPQAVSRPVYFRARSARVHAHRPQTGLLFTCKCPPVAGWFIGFHLAIFFIFLIPTNFFSAPFRPRQTKNVIEVLRVFFVP